MSLRWIWLVLSTASGAAWAQPCHEPVAPAEARPRDGVALRLEPKAAVFRTPHERGSYQGLSVRASWWSTRLSAVIQVPLYRIETGATASFGPGDPITDLSVTLSRSSDSSREAGLGLGASLPAGAVDRSLGMGHVMLMGRAWAAATWRRFATAGQVGYGRALASAAASSVHGGHGGPVVSPMSQSEVTAGAAAAFSIVEDVRALAGTSAAFPVAAAGGARLGFWLGGEALFARWETGLRFETTVLGSPSSKAATTWIGYRF